MAQPLIQEKFQEIYSNEEFRNAVAYAHDCCDKYGHFLHKKALVYPMEYIVTDDQIEKAQKLIDKRKKEVIVENEGKLMFVAMGGQYNEIYPDDVCNHRIRTEFMNTNGNKYFIEVSRGRGEEMIIDHAHSTQNNPDEVSFLERQTFPLYTKKLY